MQVLIPNWALILCGWAFGAVLLQLFLSSKLPPHPGGYIPDCITPLLHLTGHLIWAAGYMLVTIGLLLWRAG